MYFIIWLYWAKIDVAFPYKMCIFFSRLWLFSLTSFKMFRISKNRRAFTLIQIANYTIIPLKEFLLGIFVSLVVNCLGINCQVDRLKIALGWAFRLQWEDFMINNYFCFRDPTFMYNLVFISSVYGAIQIASDEDVFQDQYIVIQMRHFWKIWTLLFSSGTTDITPVPSL